jgi:hypothetical protein
MSKITKKGIIKKVGVVEKVGVENTEKQSLVLYVPARSNEFGEVVGQADYFEIAVMGKKVREFNLSPQLLEKKVEVEMYLNGRQYDKIDGSKGYAHNLNLAKITVIEGNQAVNAPQEKKMPENF